MTSFSTHVSKAINSFYSIWNEEFLFQVIQPSNSTTKVPISVPESSRLGDSDDEESLGGDASALKPLRDRVSRDRTASAEHIPLVSTLDSTAGVQGGGESRTWFHLLMMILHDPPSMISPTHREKQSIVLKRLVILWALYLVIMCLLHNAYRAMLQPTCLKIVLMCRVSLPTKIILLLIKF